MAKKKASARIPCLICRSTGKIRVIVDEPIVVNGRPARCTYTTACPGCALRGVKS